MDESTDTPDSAQLSVFICGVNSSLCLTEGLWSLQSTGKDLLKVRMVNEMRNLEENLRHTADGASPTCGHKRRWVGSSRRTKMKTLEVSSSHTKNQVEKLQKCSCYEHKTASEAKGLNHCQWFKSFMLKSFLPELSSDYGDFPHNTEVSG